MNADVTAHHMLIPTMCFIVHHVKQLFWFILSCQFIMLLFSFLGGVMRSCIDRFFVVGQGANSFLCSSSACILQVQARITEFKDNAAIQGCTECLSRWVLASSNRNLNMKSSNFSDKSRSQPLQKEQR